MGESGIYILKFIILILLYLSIGKAEDVKWSANQKLIRCAIKLSFKINMIFAVIEATEDMNPNKANES